MWAKINVGMFKQILDKTVFTGKCGYYAPSTPVVPRSGPTKGDSVGNSAR